MRFISEIRKPLSSSRYPILRRMRGAIGLFVVTLLAGVVGFEVLLPPGHTWIDALYVTVVTLSTIGYGDVVTTTQVGRLFTTGFILVGIGTASYSAAVLIGAVIEGELQGEIARRRMSRRIEQLHGHIILCGFGRIGVELAEEFHAENVPFVVIEGSDAAIARGEALGYLMLKGDATTDETLELAGIAHARAIIPVLASDADNLFIVISARQLNHKATILARATDPATESKMRKAGADRVIRPMHIGAQHMAQAALRPTVLDFVQVTGRSAKHEYTIEEVPVIGGSSFIGRSLAEANFRQEVGVILIGIKRVKGDLVFNPSANTEIQAGDILVAMGDDALLGKLKRLAGAKESEK